MPNSSSTETAPRLTPRELQILKLLGEGHRNSEIAELLFLSVRSVEKYRSNLNSALTCSDCEDFAALARHHRLID